jgi:hypothetical protein
LQRTRRAAANQSTAETRPETLAAQPEVLALQPEAPPPQPQAPQPEAALARPPIDNAAAAIRSAGTAITSAAKHNGMTWTQSYRQRQTTKRLAKKPLKAQARLAAQHVTRQGATSAAI